MVQNLSIILSPTFPWHSSMPFTQALVLPPESRAQYYSSAPLVKKPQAAMRPPLHLLFSRLKKPRDLSRSAHALPSIPFTIFVAIFWMLSFMLFSHTSAKTCTKCRRWGYTCTKQSGTILSLIWLAVLGLVHPWAPLASKAQCWLKFNLSLTRTPRSLSVGADLPPSVT